MGSLDTSLTETAPELQLSHPSPGECQTIWNIISEEWRDALSLDEFMEESAYLLTVPLAKDGGMTMWVLVEKDSVPDQRAILATCESFRERALVSTPEGKIEDVVVHGIASVFCDPKYRGKGYPKRMLSQLAQVLRTWQLGAGEKCVGSVLYSDIGKKYYASIGWKAAPNNTHIEFPAHLHLKLDGVKMLEGKDLAQLCKEDEEMARKDLAKLSTTGRQRMMIIPDHDHMLWHHCKVKFATERLFGGVPRFKGAIVGEPDSRIWAIWTHRFYDDPQPVPSGNVLHILRLVIEDPGRDSEVLQAQLQLIFQSAQAEAASWNLDEVDLWDPHPRVQRLVRRMDIEHAMFEREEEGIASLYWYDEEEKGRPDWIANERYAWC
ncbi:uncharacterized protein LY89DRAFT_352507 [Mollisia scopiformis]|uniref:LYC1 C-terminal domain-containing protein n=1 Tax=Mollisia scopiformis TaxID=149040 RepID=A0A132B687_MOLSC|nr:uncharacterized protein LY89DRAFT_352507 [Mollisia scopiformis]KUJ07773.1 hypothetical protein LY89DRAFT_352507 [Mollisia scopiformis]